jgi:hypothetical protein
MLAAQIEELLSRLKAGTYDSADIEVLERTSAKDLLDERGSSYRFRFQERRLRNKREIGAARSLRYEIVPLLSRPSSFPFMIMVPVFRDCIFLSGEGDSITGLSTCTRLSAKRRSKGFGLPRDQDSNSTERRTAGM